MNDEAADVKKLLAPLRERPLSVADGERLAARRTRVVAALKQENVRLHMRRSRRRAASFGAAAVLALAAATALLVGGRHLGHPAIAAEPRLTVLHGDTTGTGHPLGPGETVPVAESELQTAEHGSAELESTTGLNLNLGEATRLSVAGILGDAKTNHVELRQGEVTCKVPHLAEGEHFSVVTPDARVVVHGTVFSVRFDPTLNSDNKTCVRVTQGVVIVHHASEETALNAGDSWGCTPPEPQASQDALQGAANDSDRGATARTAPHSAARGTAAPHSTLAEENRLLQSALAAERVGNRDQARATLQTLLSEYPNSPLSREASRALARVSTRE